VFTRPGAASEGSWWPSKSRSQDFAAVKAEIVARVSEEFQLAVSDWRWSRPAPCEDFVRQAAAAQDARAVT